MEALINMQKTCKEWGRPRQSILRPRLRVRVVVCLVHYRHGFNFIHREPLERRAFSLCVSNTGKKELKRLIGQGHTEQGSDKARI